MAKKQKRNVPMHFSDRVRDGHRRLTEADQARKSGDTVRAIKLGESLIDDYPDYVAALHTLGLAHMSRNAFWPALSCFMRAAMLNPGDWTILASLAQAYLGLGANEMAARTLEQARAINEDDPEIHYTLGLIYDREREYERAASALERALELKEDHGQAAMALGLCQVHLGDQEAAGNSFLRSHRLGPTEIGPISASAQLSRQYSLFDEEAALATLADKQKKGSEALESRMAFTRAHLLHGKGDFQAAWDELVTANALVAKGNSEGLSRHIERRETIAGLIKDFKVSDLPEAKTPTQPVSLYILGVSRSGKTTVERVVGGMPGVKCGYENPIVELAVQRASQGAGLLTMRLLWDLPASLGDAFAAHYQTELSARASDAKVFTNTHPGRIVADRYLFGIFGGVGKVFFGSTEDDAYTQWLAGVEGQAYFGNTTIFGQGGFLGAESNDSTSQNILDDGWFLRGVARHHVNGGDTKLEGEFGWATGVNDNTGGDGTESVDVLWWGAEVEHAVHSFGDDGFVSVFGRYEGYYVDEASTGEDGMAHIFLAGIRMDLNQMNPLARERSGVAVDLPNMTRINGAARLVE